ncbi:MaoC family dehydratase [Actinomadura madurae]|uniref:MaoC family dehydratase n=1 Tax=Actinomadura madurae TaxID=1993 RepID=UPI0027E30031|nr:MaoC family dehydratase [Actinomadura madurae]
MRTFTGVDEYEKAVGTHLGHSEWHTITQEQVNLFADATGDHQWIHLDTERAAQGPFGTTIAHGYLTLSLIPMLLAQIYRVEGLRMGVNYGANKVRFPAPVPVGSRVRAGAELLSLERGPAGRPRHRPGDDRARGRRQARVRRRDALGARRLIRCSSAAGRSGIDGGPEA